GIDVHVAVERDWLAGRATVHRDPIIKVDVVAVRDSGLPERSRCTQQKRNQKPRANRALKHELPPVHETCTSNAICLAPTGSKSFKNRPFWAKLLAASDVRGKVAKTCGSGLVAWMKPSPGFPLRR